MIYIFDVLTTFNLIVFLDTALLYNYDLNFNKVLKILHDTARRKIKEAFNISTCFSFL